MRCPGLQLRHPTASIVAGATAVGLQLNDWRGPKDGAGRRAAAAGAPSRLLSIASISELHGCEVVATATGSGAMLAGEFDETTAGDDASSLLHVPDRRGKSTISLYGRGLICFYVFRGTLI